MPVKKRAKRTERVPPEVGERMRIWRKSQGPSLTKIAKQIGVTKGHLSQVETGQGNLSLPAFLDFCKAIGVPTSTILEDRILAKDRDFERLAADLVKALGVAELNWLARLSRPEAGIALQGARDAVDLDRLRKSQRAKTRRKPPTTRAIPRKR